MLATGVLVVVPSAPAQAADVFVGTATRPTGDGYWSTTAQGVVKVNGSAGFFGDLQGVPLNRAITGIASTPTGNGYWLVATDGGIFGFGDARFYGSTGAMRLNLPVTGMAATATGNVYWLVASDGGIFAFGDADFYGSTGGLRLNRPIIGMAGTPSGNGYWMLGDDGGIFAFGDADFYGSTGGMRLNAPVVGIASTPTGHGYWLVASDGGIFSFGDAPFHGSTPGTTPVLGLAPDGMGGYDVLSADGRVQSFKKRLAPTTTTTTTVPPVTTVPPGTTTTTTPTVTAPPTTVPVTTTTTIPTTTTTRPPTTTTTVPTTTTTTVAANGNPFAGRALWVDPSNPARRQASDWQWSRPADAAYMQRMGNTAAAAWMGGWSGDIASATNGIVSQAASQNSVPVMIAYNIPKRDCGQWSAGGAAQESDYRAWIQGMANGIGNRRAVVILEPDALAQLDCIDDASRTSRLALLSQAVDTLTTNPLTTVYLDAGHPGWHSADTMAARLNAAGVAKARGFSLNVSNFDSTASNVVYGNELSARLSGKKFVVDTSRNGRGSNGEWCNPTGRALGLDPTTNTGQPAADAYLWLKRPGESDGNCNGGPSAGTWWADYALGLAKAAWG